MSNGQMEQSPVLFSHHRHSRTSFRSSMNGHPLIPGVLEYFGGKSLMTQSHGQSLMSYFSSRYTRKGLYLMDEPETSLSPKSQLALLRVIHTRMSHGHAQFIIATHSSILLSCPDSDIFCFDTLPIRKIAYEATDHFRIYKDFMVNRERYFQDK